MNALVNPGAITATSMVQGKTADEIWGSISSFYNAAAGRQLTVLQDVYESEAATNQRNQAIGMLMFAYGYIKANPLQAVDIYTKQSDLGTAILVGAAGFYVIFFAGLPWRIIVGMIVGGGIIAVSPGKFGIAVISPPLDDAGSSVRAQKAIADMSNALGGNPYAVARARSHCQVAQE